MKPVISDRTFLYSLLTLPNLSIRVICGQIDFSKTNPIFRILTAKSTIAPKNKANQTHRSVRSYIRTFLHPSTPANFAVKKDLINLHALHGLHGKKICAICGQIDFSKTKPIFRVLAAKSTIAAKNKPNQTRPEGEQPCFAKIHDISPKELTSSMKAYTLYPSRERGKVKGCMENPYGI